MFVDYVKITIKAGKGGDGSMAFRRKNMCRTAALQAAMAAREETWFL